MQYILYIDMFFLVNFFMDIVVMSISKKILKCPVTYKNILFSASVAALLTSIVVSISTIPSFVKLVIFHGLINFLMIKTGLRVKGKVEFLKSYAVVYVTSFLVGGVFSSLKQYIRETGMFILFAFISYYAVLNIWRFLSYMNKCTQRTCDVLLKNGTKQIKVKAILDTGNRLRDIVTGKPVCIISRKVADILWKELPVENLRYIPYHTIGKKEGVLPMLVLPEMCLYMEREEWFSRVLVAIGDETIGTGEYGMILNPDIR